jgi:hypothetical protein
MTWAFGLSLKPATAKFVLVALADNADDEGRAFPSIDCLINKTSLDRKTVIHALDQLEKMELATDTGNRVGRTKQIKVYRLNLKKSETGTLSQPTERVPEFPEGTDNGTAERVPKIPSNSTVFPSKGTVFPSKGSQKRDTESSGNPQEPSGNRKSARARRVPADFEVTEEMRKWARSRVPEVDVDAETEKFRDHEYADPKSDWIAAWRTWMRNSLTFSRSGGRGPSREDAPKLTWRPPPDEEGADAPR